MYTVMLYPKSRANGGRPQRTPPKRVDFGVAAYSGSDRNSAERFAQAAVLDRQAVAVVREDNVDILVFDTENVVRVKSRPPRTATTTPTLHRERERPVALPGGQRPSPAPEARRPVTTQAEADSEGLRMTSVRVINRFLDAQRAVPNGRPAVAIFSTGERVKIIAARTKKGQLQARLAATGKWAPVMYITPG